MNFIYVFRGGKYWKFNNKPKPNEPFGDLVDGGVLAKNKWPGIRFPGGAAFDGNKLIMVYKNKWSRWRPRSRNQGSSSGPTGGELDTENPDMTTDSGIKDLHPTRSISDDTGATENGVKNIQVTTESIENDYNEIELESDGQNGIKPIYSDIIEISEQPIREEEIPDEPNGDEINAGALIPPENNDGKYTKIKENRVCFYVIKKEKLHLSGKCITLDQNDHKYPANTVAAIKPEDNNWYFINNEGKYCKRADKVYDEVIKDLDKIKKIYYNWP